MEPYGQIQTGAAPVGGRRHMPVVIGALLLVAAGLLWLGIRSSSPGGGVTLSVRPPITQVQIGQEFTVNVFMDAAGYSLTAADLVITFDPRMLRAVGISPGALMPTVLAKGSVSEGRAVITVGSGTTPAFGDGIVAHVTFRALASGESDVSLADNTQAAAAGQSRNVVGRLVPARIVVR